MRSLRSSEEASAILAVAASMLTKGSASKEGVELLVQGVCCCLEGVSENGWFLSISDLGLMFWCSVLMVFGSSHPVIVDHAICYDSTGDLWVEGVTGCSR